MGFVKIRGGRSVLLSLAWGNYILACIVSRDILKVKDAFIKSAPQHVQSCFLYERIFQTYFSQNPLIFIKTAVEIRVLLVFLLGFALL